MDTTSCSELCIQMQTDGRWSNARSATMWKDLENVQWWSLVSQCISDQLVRTMQCEAETRGCCAVSMWEITRDMVQRSSSRQTV